MLPIIFHKLISSFCEFIATEGTFVQLIKRYYAAHFLESPISNFFTILNMHSTMTNYQTYYCDFFASNTYHIVKHSYFINPYI